MASKEDNNYQINTEIRIKAGERFFVFPEGSIVSASNTEPHEDLGSLLALQKVSIALISTPENYRELDDNEELLEENVFTGMALASWKSLRKKLAE